jgi:hypothetical protein
MRFAVHRDSHAIFKRVRLCRECYGMQEVQKTNGGIFRLISFRRRPNKIHKGGPEMVDGSDERICKSVSRNHSRVALCARKAWDDGELKPFKVEVKGDFIDAFIKRVIGMNENKRYEIAKRILPEFFIFG